MLPIDAFDRPLFRFVNHGLAGPLLDGLMAALTYVGEYSWVALLLAAAGWTKGTPAFRRFCLLLLPAVFISDSLPNVIKLLTARPRPFTALADVRIVVPVDRLSDFGFPSNHACNVFTVATLAALFFGNRTGGAALLIAGLVAFSRVYIGVHYPSDVAAGALLGAAIAWGVRALDKRSPRWGRHAQKTAFAAMIVLGGLIQISWRVMRTRMPAGPAATHAAAEPPAR